MRGYSGVTNFYFCSHSKYALEAYHFLTQVMALQSPRQAHQLMWNRTCNPKGGAENNVELNLHQEHLNRVFKDDINTFRANITEGSIKRSGNAIGAYFIILTFHGQADMEVILKCLSKNEVFTRKPKRCHNNFKTFSNNPFKSRLKNPKGLHTWFDYIHG